MKNLFSIFLTAILIFNLSIPAFAETGVEGNANNSNSNPDVVVGSDGDGNDDSGQSGSEGSGEDGSGDLEVEPPVSEPDSEADSEPEIPTVNLTDDAVSAITDSVTDSINDGKEEVPTVNLSDESLETITEAVKPSQEMQTVNISEESVQAIADAVNTDPPASITTSDGISVKIPDVLLTVWNDYEYKACYYLNQSYRWFVGNSVSSAYLSSNGSYYLIKVKDGYRLYSSSLDATPSYGFEFSVDEIVWANFNIATEDGSVVRPSDTPLPDPIYTISFNTGFDDLVFEDQKSDNLVIPEPSYDNYKFAGWFLDESFNLPYSSDFTFTSDAVLYAKWIQSYTVSFDTGFDDLVVPDQSSLTLDIPALSYDGYVFQGWYLDSSFVTLFSPDMSIEEDLTLYAKWSKTSIENETLGIIQSQLWIVLVVGLLHYVYKFFRLFF